MATVINSTNLNRFHNLSPALLADLIGQLDKQAKSASTELDAAKDAFKARGLLVAEGETYAIVLQKTIRASSSLKRRSSAVWIWFRSLIGRSLPSRR